VGSILAARLSKYYINAGIALLGALGVTVITFTVPHLESIETIAPLFLLFGVFSGFILVPLSANIQHLAPNAHLGTILAGNNFIQNIFMILFLMLTTIFAYFGMDGKMLFTLMGFVGIVLFWLLARRYFVLFVWTLFELVASLRYKVIYKGLENIPDDKAVLLLGNHVSWLDWLFLQIPIRRRINFLMDKEIYHWPLLHPILKAGEVIPLSPRGFKDAMKEAVKRLQKGNIVAIFPEGEITRNCEMNPFRKGFELIDSFEWEGVLVPFYIDGMQGSIFAKCSDGRKKPFPRREVHVCFFAPQPKNITAEELEKFIKKERYKC